MLHIQMSFSKVDNMSAYAIGLRLTMLQIYLYQYWTRNETQKKGRVGMSSYAIGLRLTMLQIYLYQY